MLGRWLASVSTFASYFSVLGPISGTTAALWYPAVLSPGAVASPGFPGRSSPPGFLASCFLFVISVVLLRIRGFCD